jgi:hypothetical protein
VIASVLALSGTVFLGVVQLIDDDGGAEACSVMVDRVADLTREHPQLAAIYAKQDQRGLPRLADPDEVDRCGDPIGLLRALQAAKKP